MQNQACQHIPWLFWDKGEQSYLCRFAAVEFYKDSLWDAEELECSSVAVTWTLTLSLLYERMFLFNILTSSLGGVQEWPSRWQSGPEIFFLQRRLETQLQVIFLHEGKYLSQSYLLHLWINTWRKKTKLWLLALRISNLLLWFCIRNVLVWLQTIPWGVGKPMWLFCQRRNISYLRQYKYSKKYVPSSNICTINKPTGRSKWHWMWHRVKTNLLMAICRTCLIKQVLLKIRV